MTLGVLTTKEHLDAFVQGFHLELSTLPSIPSNGHVGGLC
jgi:hypothetical protein